jgi:CubicO group peptidase (beta-lactamase class C family)
MASVAAMMLYEEGKLFLSDPVGKHLPEIAAFEVAEQTPGADGQVAVTRRPAKRQPTIQDLLRQHVSAGVYITRRAATRLRRGIRWDA